MAFPPEFLDEIKARLSVSSLVAQQVKLSQKGREFQGLCPFHHEKTPSFTVNNDKGFYHCFGCGAHGTVFDYLIQKEGASFPEAVERLAELTGLEVPQQTPQAQAKSDQRQRLLDVCEAACQWFVEHLHGQQGGVGRQYLQRRGLSSVILQKFRLGLSGSGRDDLRKALLADQRGFKEQDLIDAGLIKKPYDGRLPFDFFRRRLMFPICDIGGKVIAFGARAIDDDMPKYLNSPETALFHKGRTVFGLHLARDYIRSQGYGLVCEGYMDVIALAQAGIGQAIAPLGTALTEQQLALLWRYADKSVLCFDGDNAGRKAALRAVDRALPHLEVGKSLFFCLLPQGEDPDSFVKDKGGTAFHAFLEKAQPMSEFLWHSYVEDADLDTPEQKALARQTLFEKINQIGNRDLRVFYHNDMFQRFERMLGQAMSLSDVVRSDSARQNWGRYQKKGGQRYWSPEQARKMAQREKEWSIRQETRQLSNQLMRGGALVQRRQKLCLALALSVPELLQQDFEVFSQISFSEPTLQQIQSLIISLYVDYPGLEKSARLEKIQQSVALSSVPLQRMFADILGPETQLHMVRSDPDLQRVQWQDLLRQLETKPRILQERQTQGDQTKQFFRDKSSKEEIVDAHYHKHQKLYKSDDSSEIE